MTSLNSLQCLNQHFFGMILKVLFLWISSRSMTRLSICGETSSRFFIARLESALYVHELVRLFQAYADSSALESIALFAAMSMPSLLLQRPPGKLQAKEPSKHLERHFAL